MNIYELEFFSRCPRNEVRVKYEWRVETERVLMVEDLIDAVDQMNRAFHEEMADRLHHLFGGHQVIKAFHHGVTITTTRK